MTVKGLQTFGSTRVWIRIEEVSEYFVQTDYPDSRTVVEVPLCTIK